MANPIYKQFPNARTVFCAAMACVLAFFPQVLRAQTNPAYTIEGVEVDVTAKNAVLAREKAMEEAQSKAYHMLAERLLSPEELATLKVPDPITLSALVQDFEVTKEQASRVRYKGVYTIRFRPNAMRVRMAAEGKNVSDTMKKPVLVLPVLEKTTGNDLWGQDNPWMMAWRNLPSDKNMTQPTVLPLGDSQDISQITGDVGLTMDSMEVQEMASRYGADDVAILMARAVPTQSVQGALTINLYKNGFDGPAFVKKIVVTQLPDETVDALYTRAALQIKAMLRKEWKADAAYTVPIQNNAVTTTTKTTTMVPMTRPALGPSSTYMAVAKFSSVQDWVRLKNTLDKIYGMQAVMVKGLKPREAAVDLRFAGDGRALALALQNAGVAMRGGTDGTPFEIYMATPRAVGYAQ